MSTKSKRRIERRHRNEQPAVVPAPQNKDEKQIAGAIVGELLNAITFGATESPPSARNAQH